MPVLSEVPQVLLLVYVRASVENYVAKKKNSLI